MRKKMREIQSVSKDNSNPLYKAICTNHVFITLTT